MKTATVTWITYNNYGTELQAYALQQYLKELQIENTIISDKDIVIKSKTKFPKEVVTKITETPQKRILRLLKKYCCHPVLFFKILCEILSDFTRKKEEASYFESQQCIEQFKKNDLTILYGKTRHEMTNLNDEFDAFICGSDQIWSTIERNFDGFFYLDFANKKKISYAASIGSNIIPDNKTSKISEWLQGFSAISVREEKTAEQLSKLLKKPVQWVADPTLLHNSDFWTSFSQDFKVPKSQYLLCYFLENKEWYHEYAMSVAKYLNLKLVIIPSRVEITHRKGVLHSAVGPREFVGLFRSADYILTDSYHGSIFSLIFEKKFLYLKRFCDGHPENQNIRIESLFGYLGILNNIVEEKKFDSDDMKYLSYAEISKKLVEFREKSREYIQFNLKESL